MKKTLNHIGTKLTYIVLVLSLVGLVLVLSLVGPNIGYSQEVRKIAKPSYPKSVLYNVTAQAIPVRDQVGGIVASTLDSVHPSMAEMYEQLYDIKGVTNDAYKGFKSGVLSVIKTSLNQEIKNALSKSLLGVPYKNPKQNSSFALTQKELQAATLPFDPHFKLDVFNRNVEIGGSKMLSQGVEALAIFDSEHYQLRSELLKKTKDGYNVHLKTSHAFSDSNETQVEVGFNFRF
ncbi:MAG: hypothetical protein HYS98_05945 [Deltaproteobacteria bacterium]|nr:hypothetical protein [Deltaproteobacteria bacterium]